MLMFDSQASKQNARHQTKFEKPVIKNNQAKIQKHEELSSSVNNFQCFSSQLGP